jgi:hypothetical protein
MILEKIARITLSTLLLLIPVVTVFAQENSVKDPDYLLKETLYNKYKREAQAFDKKQFDALFFEFFQKQRDKEITLTKEAFYNYTLKIAAYSEKLGLLYKDQKEDAQRTKQEWFAKSYADYLNSKK